MFLKGSIFSGIQLTLTIRIHLIRERPNPEMAPYLPAAEVVRQKDRKNPIQLKRNATVKAEKKKNKTCQTCPVIMVTGPSTLAFA